VHWGPKHRKNRPFPRVETNERQKKQMGWRGQRQVSKGTGIPSGQAEGTSGQCHHQELSRDSNILAELTKGGYTITLNLRSTTDLSMSILPGQIQEHSLSLTREVVDIQTLRALSVWENSRTRYGLSHTDLRFSLVPLWAGQGNPSEPLSTTVVRRRELTRHKRKATCPHSHLATQTWGLR
jgi:hypothetical protein